LGAHRSGVYRLFGKGRVCGFANQNACMDAGSGVEALSRRDIHGHAMRFAATATDPSMWLRSVMGEATLNFIA